MSSTQQSQPTQQPSNNAQEGQSSQQMPSYESQMQQQQQQKEQEERRSSMMSQCMLPEARERLSRLAIVKPEKARSIEDSILQMAQKGQLRNKIDEPQIIEMLNRAGTSDETKRTKVTMKRRTYFSDEEDDDDDDDF